MFIFVMAAVHSTENEMELKNVENPENCGTNATEATNKTLCTELGESVEPANLPSSNLLYSVEDVPPWYLTGFLGLQQFMTMLGSMTTIPFILAPLLCISENDPARAYIISTMIFVSGFITLIQSTFGVRLPIIQGCTFSLLIPTLSILKLPEWSCPSTDDKGNITTTLSLPATTITWQQRICEVQGAIIVATLLEVFLGLTGLVGYLVRFVTPLSITPVITLIGLALFENAAENASGHWGISMLTVLLLLLFSQYLHEVSIPFFSYSRKKGFKLVWFDIFKLFPILLAIIVVWVFCYILTESGVLPADNAARTDRKTELLDRSPWFRFPYPGQWGMPTVSLAGVVGMTGGVVATILEALGNYNACARMCGAPPPPTHAINRGIFVEGVGTGLSAIWGTGNGTTSYAENIGVIGVTKVGSRRVIQAAGIIMMICGLICKFGALFVMIPEPIIGGVFFITFSMIAAVGLGNLQFVNMNSPRNLIVLGVPLFFGLAIPKWLEKHGHPIKTGSRQLDEVLDVILSTSMFVGGALALFLDNTVPATDEDRKAPVGEEHFSSGADATSKCYDFPFGMQYLKNSTVAKYLPISPCYEPTRCQSSCCKRKQLDVNA